MKKQRIALDLTPEAVQQLDELKVLAGARTRAEVIRNGLWLYRWFLDQTTQGYEVVLKNLEDQNKPEKVVALLMSK